MKKNVEAELFATLYSIGDAVISTDIEGRVMRMNSVAEKLTGWPEQEAKGKPLSKIFQIIHELSRKQLKNPVAKVLKQKKTITLTNHTLLISRKGQEIPITDSSAPIRDGAGDIIGVVLVFRDKSEERLSRRITETHIRLIEYANTHTLAELLTKALDEVGKFVNSPIGFYHFVEEDQKTLSLQQWSTRTLREFCQAEGHNLHYGIDQAGVWVDCVHQRKPVIHNDYESLPHKKGMPDGHAKIIRELVVPVMREGKVVSILGVGNKPTDYTEKDAEIISCLADVTWEIVRKKKAEEELLKNKKRLEEVFNHSRDVVYKRNLQTGCYEYMSPAIFHITGYTANEVMAKTPVEIYEYFHPEDLDKLIRLNQKLLENPEEGKSNTIEYRLRHKDGSWRWISDHFLLLCSEEGTLFTISSMRDITALKQAELKLLENENKYRTLYETMAQGAVYQNKEGHIISANRAAQEILGFNVDQMLDRTSHDSQWNAIHEDGSDFPGETHPSMVALNKGKEVRDEIMGVYNPKLKKYIWIKVHAVPQFKPHEDKPFQVYTTFEDITEQKETQSKLNQEKNRAQNYLDIAGVMIVAINAEGNVTLINQKGCEILGYSLEEITNKNWFKTFLPDNISDQVSDVFKQLMSGDTDPVEYFENPVLTKGGDQRIIAWHNTLLTDDHGQISGTLSSGEDITDRKIAEQQIEHLAKFPSENPNPVMRIDLKGRLLYANNAAFSQLTDWKLEIGKIVPEALRQFSNNKTGKFLDMIDMRCKDRVFSMAVAHPADTDYYNLYARDITQRKQAEEQIQKDLQEKEILLRELYHRTKNNMQVISSMIRLKARTLPEETGKLAFQEIENKIRTMALVHQRLYRSKDLSSLNLRDYFQDLITLIRQSYLSAGTNIRIEYDAQSANVLIDTAIPLGLVLNELLTNAIKHAFPKKKEGLISVVLEVTEKDILRLVVSDNGIGPPKNFDPEKTDRLGLMTVVDMIRHQLGGQITIENKNGFNCTIEIDHELYQPRI